MDLHPVPFFEFCYSIPYFDYISRNIGPQNDGICIQIDTKFLYFPVYGIERRGLNLDENVIRVRFVNLGILDRELPELLVKKQSFLRGGHGRDCGSREHRPQYDFRALSSSTMVCGGGSEMNSSLVHE